jgi:glyoxylase I family protein
MLPGRTRTVPELLGVDHVTLTVTDLDRSEEFYASVLGLLLLAGFGHARILVHRPTSLVVALVRHESGRGEPFTELMHWAGPPRVRGRQP